MSSTSAGDSGVSADAGPAGQAGTPSLPASIWLVAWASLAGQAVLLLREGVQDHDGTSLLLSVVLGGLLLGYVSAGVVRARTVRVWLAWIVLVLSGILELVGLTTTDDPQQFSLQVLALATTVVALVGLWRFRRTRWYAWQRTKPPARQGASTAQLVAVGVLVGMLGGIAGTSDEGIDVQINVMGP